MARTMNVDDSLYRLREVSASWAYGPYTNIGIARGMRTRIQYWDRRWGRTPHEYVIERVTAGSLTDPIWERVDG